MDVTYNRADYLLTEGSLLVRFSPLRQVRGGGKSTRNKVREHREDFTGVDLIVIIR